MTEQTRIRLIAAMVSLLVLFGITSLLFAKTLRPTDYPRLLPEFTTNNSLDWLGSAPMKRRDLLGKVVLIDVWTFECWNCYRSFPWLNSLEKKFSAEQFQIIGVHTPEFEREKNRTAVLAKMKEFNLHHPVMIDNQSRYWDALENRVWPAFYLVDKTGKIHRVYTGETHAGDPQATKIEAEITALLKQ